MTVEDRAEPDKQSFRLSLHESELNRIDTEFVVAAKTGARVPPSSNIFGALSDASISCADVVDAYGPRPIPESVRCSLMRVHCAMSDLSVSLVLYAEITAHKGPLRSAH